MDVGPQEMRKPEAVHFKLAGWVRSDALYLNWLLGMQQMRKWVERVRGSSVNMSGLGCLLGSPSEMLRRPSSTQSWGSREGSRLEMQSCGDYTNTFVVRLS